MRSQLQSNFTLNCEFITEMEISICYQVPSEKVSFKTILKLICLCKNQIYHIGMIFQFSKIRSDKISFIYSKLNSFSTYGQNFLKIYKTIKRKRFNTIYILNMRVLLLIPYQDLIKRQQVLISFAWATSPTHSQNFDVCR